MNNSDTSHYENVPFEVPDGWCWTTLGEIGNWQAGATPSRMRKDYYGGNIPWLKTGDLTDGYICEIPETITDKALEETSVKLNPTGSVLIAMYGATIGKIGILTFPATTNQACCACVDYKAVTQKYLFYFLLSYKEEFVKMGGGGAQPNISKEKIISTLIPVPPIAEQNRIADEIERLIAFIETIDLNQGRLEQSLKLCKERILDMALSGKLIPQDQDDEPAIELLRKINPSFAPTDNRHYENLPSGWQEVAFDHIFKSIPTKRFQVQQKEIQPKGTIPVISQSANYIEGYTDDIDKIFTATPVIVFGDHTRVVKFVDFPFVVGADGVKIYSTKIFPPYGYYLIEHAAHNIENKGYGRHSQYIAKQRYPLPPYDEQKRIVESVRKMFMTIDSIVADL